MTRVARALTARERAVLEAMISLAGDVDGSPDLDTASRERWLARVPGMRAGRRCGCGQCPSIELEDASGRTPSRAGSRVVLSAGAAAALVLLFVDDDQPSYLELAPTDPDGRFDEFPAVESMDFTPAGP